MSQSSAIENILITGGNGCLGRFLVDLLVQHYPQLCLIRILDKSDSGKSFFEEKYSERHEDGDNRPAPRIEYICADIRKRSAVRQAVKGIDCVFHMAGVVDVSMFPDENLMWAVNCRGTQDLVEECYEASVRYLIFTSSVNSIVGHIPLKDAKESDCSKPEQWLWKGYGETKWFAERIVLDADALPLPNGTTMRTLCLRPTVFYGENDQTFIVEYLRIAEKFGKRFFPVGRDDEKIQQTYVGNVAWAHLCAMDSLTKNPDECAGFPFFITDNTPVMNPSRLVEPFLEDRGISKFGFSIPFFIIYYGILFLLFLLNLCKKLFPDWKCLKSVKLFSLSQIRFLQLGNTFDRSRAEQLLNYKPLFSFEDSLIRSAKFYGKTKF